MAINHYKHPKSDKLSGNRLVSDQTNSDRLRFDSHDEALNHLKEMLKDSKNRLLGNTLNIVKNYLEGVFVLKILFSINGTSDKNYFVFHAIPLRGDEKLRPFPSPISTLQVAQSSTDRERPDNSMFLGITKGVQTPDQIIPSFVWFERGDEVSDFRRYPLTDTISKDSMKFCGIFPNREKGSPFKVKSISQRSDGINNLVESGAQVINNIKHMPVQGNRHGFGKLQLKQVMRTICVEFSDSFAYARFKESLPFSLKFEDVFLCPKNPEL